MSDEGLKNAGVTDPKLFKTLGVFGFVLVFLLICVGIYFLLRWCIRTVKAKKYPKLNTLANKMEEKLFYSSFLRYMIVSNLKLTYTVWGFFILTTGAIAVKNPLMDMVEPFQGKVKETITITVIDEDSSIKMKNNTKLIHLRPWISLSSFICS